MNQVLKGKTEAYLEARIDEIIGMEAGSETENAAIKNFVAVYGLKNEEDKIEMEADIKVDVLETDDKFKRDQLESELRIKKEQFNRDDEFRRRQSNLDEDFRRNQLKHDLIVSAASVAGTVVVACLGDLIYVKLTHEGWLNEAKGYYPSSATFKGVFGKLSNLIKK